jgi:hypothetical protein
MHARCHQHVHEPPSGDARREAAAEGVAKRKTCSGLMKRSAQADVPQRAATTRKAELTERDALGQAPRGSRAIVSQHDAIGQGTLHA